MRDWTQTIAGWFRNIRPAAQLYARGNANIVVAAAAVKDSTDFNVPKGRGDVQAYAIIIGSEAGILDSELMSANISFSVDGVSSLEEIPAMSFDKAYRFERRTIFPQVIPESASVNITVTNPGTKAISVGLLFYYYDPLQNFNIPVAD